MPALEENALTKVITVSGVDMKTAASVALYVCPVGKTFIPCFTVIRNNSASLAGGTSYAFTNWRSGIDLSGLTVTSGYRALLSVDNTTYTPIAGGATFYLIITTGSTAACTATWDVWGYLV